VKSFSIVIPCYYSEDTIELTVQAIHDELCKDYELDFVLVNDGSTDGTWEAIKRLRERYPVTAINLRRNFGEHNTVMTGLRHVRGEAALIVDDDLQYPPSEIPKLITKLQEGYSVVYGRYIEKQHGLFRNIGSWINGAVANLVLDKESKVYLSSFKVIQRDLIDEVVAYDGPFVYIDGLIMWLTQNYCEVDVRHVERAQGRSNYTFRRLLRLHMNLLTGFSVVPLRLAALLGFVMAGVGCLLAIVFSVERLMNPQLPLGWASTMVVLLLIGGITLLMLGIIGEYVGRIFILLNRKPQASIRELLPAKPPRPDSSAPFTAK
jgi:glycosyltransferase involved in cell wall biosynthesis